ncbi:MAG: endonuclease/exonuclease/phosphatase family protein [Bacteroidetes bacterium]|nr:MAG: endonuclease/exonuclease/phosphatase family protein [Bacteroidota bacterium]
MFSRRRLLRLLLILIGLPLLYVAGAIGLAMLTDYQPAPTEAVAWTGGTADTPPDTLRFLTWNLGYGGLGYGADFFYDGGETVRMPRDSVAAYVAGSRSTLAQLEPKPDFLLLQEVDRASRRSYQTDMTEGLTEALPAFGQAFATNYDVTYIPIPLLNPMGGVLSGLLTMSPYRPDTAVRHAFAGNYAWPTGLFFLDRCFLAIRYARSDGDLLVINTHNSAFDDGSLRATQMEQLAGALRQAYAEGMYVIVGGDWNQTPPGFAGVPGLPAPDWAVDGRFQVPAAYPDTGWQWVFDPTVPTNRHLVAAFDPDTTPRNVIDFFLVSPNVEPLSVRGVDLGFRHSDHQPVQMEVALRP